MAGESDPSRIMVGLLQSKVLHWWPEMCLAVYFEDLVLSPTIQITK